MSACNSICMDNSKKPVLKKMLRLPSLIFPFKYIPVWWWANGFDTFYVTDQKNVWTSEILIWLTAPLPISDSVRQPANYYYF